MNVPKALSEADLLGEVRWLSLGGSVVLACPWHPWHYVILAAPSYVVGPDGGVAPDFSCPQLAGVSTTIVLEDWTP